MGRLGKDKNPLVRAGLAWLVWGLTACAAGGDGRYAGTVVAYAGMCGLGGDGKTSAAVLTVRGKEAVFAPDEGVVLLRGPFDASTGHLTATTTTPGADHKPFVMVFEGELRDGRVEGRYATPRCRASVRLSRAG